MQAVPFDARLVEASGYAYIVVPDNVLEAGQKSPVMMTVNGQPFQARVVFYADNQQMIQFRAEDQFNLGIKPGTLLHLTIEAIAQPPQLNDLPADFLSALTGPALGEDFKRLPPEEQRRLLDEVEAEQDPEQRAGRIHQIVERLRSIKYDLPRGDSL